MTFSRFKEVLKRRVLREIRYRMSLSPSPLPLPKTVTWNYDRCIFGNVAGGVNARVPNASLSVSTTKDRMSHMLPRSFGLGFRFHRDVGYYTIVFIKEPIDWCFIAVFLVRQRRYRLYYALTASSSFLPCLPLPRSRCVHGIKLYYSKQLGLFSLCELM